MALSALVFSRVFYSDCRGRVAPRGLRRLDEGFCAGRLWRVRAASAQRGGFGPPEPAEGAAGEHSSRRGCQIVGCGFRPRARGGSRTHPSASAAATRRCSASMLSFGAFLLVLLADARLAAGTRAAAFAASRQWGLGQPPRRQTARTRRKAISPVPGGREGAVAAGASAADPGRWSEDRLSRFDRISPRRRWAGIIVVRWNAASHRQRTAVLRALRGSPARRGIQQALPDRGRQPVTTAAQWIRFAPVTTPARSARRIEMGSRSRPGRLMSGARLPEGTSGGAARKRVAARWSRGSRRLRLSIMNIRVNLTGANVQPAGGDESGHARNGERNSGR